MEHAALPWLKDWESFYVIVGSSAAALTGLQFVVIVLSAEAQVATEHTTRAFGTPTIVHFCAVLLISAILSAPWHSLTRPALALAAGGIGGIVYAAIVIRHAKQQTSYKPVMEDWIWHGALPLVAYTTLFTASLALGKHPIPALFLVGATALLLLFIGIHNAWDAVTYIAQKRPSGGRQD